MGFVLRWLFRLVLVLVLVVGFGAGWVTWRFHASKPRLEGDVVVAGVGAPVSIMRDAHGVPHIFGETDEDVFFAIGYAHAQDRLFQMDLIRRTVEGRLSEIAGPPLVRLDARMLTRGYHRSAQRAADATAGATRAALDAYAAGVNARMAEGALAPEFALFLYTPEPWDNADTAAVWFYMADLLVAGISTDYDPLNLAEVLTPEQIGEFLPDYPDFAPIALSAADMGLVAPVRAETVDEPEAVDDDAAPRSEVEEDPAPGSNNWVVDGTLTASGAPLLANDPHLPIGAPSVWYMARMALSSGDVVGYTLPGTPFVVLGRNEHAAWAFTNAQFDVVDVRPHSPGELETRDREEVIAVRFGADVTITVRETDDGPVLDPAWFNVDIFNGDDVVLHTTADDADTDIASASLGLMTMRSWDDFVEAGRGWTAPIQNILYADVHGDVGYHAPGRVPIRDENGDWRGSIPFDDLPRVRNPASGMIVTANNRITPDEYPYEIHGEYGAYRAMRIEERLVETRLHDAASFRDVQLDTVSSHARRLLAALRRAQPQTDLGYAALGLLEDWDGDMAGDLVEPLIFSAWLRELGKAVYEDELGEMFPGYNYPRRVFLDHVLNGRLSQWCDDVTTDGDRETCAARTGLALDRAAERLVLDFGADPAAWSWGEAHQARFNHPIPFFNTLPVLKGLFPVTAPHGGDGSTVNVGHFSTRSGNFETFHAASMRSIYDLSDLDASLFIHAPGQSGHPLSPHHHDLAPMWAAGEYIEIRTDWEVDAPPPGMHVLTLSPAQ